MSAPTNLRRVLAVPLLVALVAASVSFLLLPALAVGAVAPSVATGPHTLPSSVLVSAPPSGAKGPDDITSHSLKGDGTGAALIWTAYQNGINPNGTPGSTGGPTQSTIAGYNPVTGTLVRTINVTGKVDGLTSDPNLGRLIATVNEDDNSAIYVVNQTTGTAAQYTYTPNPAVSGNGGTDSIAIWNGNIYVTHSNPNDTTQASEYLVTLHPFTHVASLAPVFFDNSRATNAVSGTVARMALTDPDTNYVMPMASPMYAGELATISQGDGKIIFAHHGVHHNLQVLNLTDNVTGNVPPIDSIAVATSNNGTLYVVDAKAGTITALVTNGWAKGTVFVSEPNDNGNPLIGTLDLSTGKITPLGNSFVSPKGLLFVPDLGPHHGVSHAPSASAASNAAVAALRAEMRVSELSIGASPRLG